MNTCSQNFIVPIYFWPKLMWVGSIKEVNDLGKILMHKWLMDLFLYKATRIIDVLLGNYAKDKRY